MSQLIPFVQTGGLPAHFRTANPDINKDVFSAPQYNTMSIKGKRWAVKKDGVSVVLMKPGTDDEVAQHIEVVALRVAPKTKVFYLKKYNDDSTDAGPPDCHSMDGITPSQHARAKQSKSCATCPHNEWGSRVNDDGESKGRACADFARIALATPDKLDDPYLLRVPPASLKPMREMMNLIVARGYPYNGVVLRLGFDINAASPKLTFKAAGLLNEADFAISTAQYDTQTVRAIVGVDDHAEAAEPAAAPPATPADDGDWGARGGDTAAETPPPPPPPPAKKTTSAKTKPPAPPTNDDSGVSIPADLASEMDALLGTTDD